MKNIRTHSRVEFALALGLLLAVLLLPLPARAAKKLTIVTTTSDMAALAQEVGGDRVTVESIAKGYQDPHFLSKPNPASC